MSKQKLIIITGPTGIGKSDLAIKLAVQFNGEIISADSMQIYKSMDIGTGKTLLKQRCGIVHHMIDVISPDKTYSVGAYISAAKKTILQIASRNKLPFLVGGTGLYINSLLSGHTFSTTPRNEDLREQLNSRDIECLYNELKEVDLISAQTINPNDKKRIVRALEIFYVSGKPKSQQADLKTESDYDYLLFVLTADRTGLYQKIESRIDKMLTQGLMDEVKSLSAIYSPLAQSMQAIGYKELITHFKGEMSFEETVERLKMNTRRYAKRQITYFKNMPLRKEFFDVGDKGSVAQMVQKIELFIKE